jgi:hypothetical protein
VNVTATDGSVTSAVTFTWRIAGAGTFTSVAPARILDTRLGLGAPKGKVARYGTVSLKVLGRGGVPASGVGSVVLNVVATGTSTAGYVTVFAGGVKRPGTSNLNYPVNGTVANLVTVPVGADGTVSLYTLASAHLVADVSGYYVNGTPTSTGSFKAMSSARLLDTRYGTGVAKKRVASQTTVSLQVLGKGGMPGSGVSAVVLNVTAVNPHAQGYITVYPSGSPKPARPLASNLNFVVGQTIPNQVLVPVGNDGKVQIYVYGGAGVDLVADVSGYYLSTSHPAVAGSFVAKSPSRIVDTRSGTGGYQGRLGGGDTLPVQITGVSGIPAGGVSTVALNMLIVSPTAPGYVTVFSDDLFTIPGTSNLNFVSRLTVANLALVPVSSAGAVDMTVATVGQAYLVADVVGYFKS